MEILRQIRADLKDGLDGLRNEVRSTNERLDVFRQDVNARLDQVNLRVDNVTEMQNVLVQEHRKTNQRLDFFAEELIRMR